MTEDDIRYDFELKVFNDPERRESCYILRTWDRENNIVWHAVTRDGKPSRESVASAMRSLADWITDTSADKRIQDYLDRMSKYD